MPNIGTTKAEVECTALSELAASRLIVQVELWTWFNTLRSRQNGRNFSEDIFKHIWFSSKIWLKYIPRGPIDNKPELV